MDSLESIIVVIGCAISWAACLWMLPLAWRNERGLHLDTPPPWWPLSPSAYRAWARCFPVLLVSWLVWVPLAGLTALLGEDSAGYSVWGPVVGVIVLVTFVWIGSVALTNRPTFLVAPHHRGQPGWLDERDGKQPSPTPAPTHPPKWHHDR